MSKKSTHNEIVKDKHFAKLARNYYDACALTDENIIRKILSVGEHSIACTSHLAVGEAITNAVLHNWCGVLRFSFFGV